MFFLKAHAHMHAQGLHRKMRKDTKIATTLYHALIICTIKKGNTYKHLSSQTAQQFASLLGLLISVDMQMMSSNTEFISTFSNLLDII